MGVKEVVTAPRSPWQNPYVERIIGSIRRECLDHIIIFNERQLRRVLSSYFQYHHQTPISRLTRIVRNLAPYTQPSRETLSPSRRLVACIIATNAAPRELFW
jgi:Integrase core domain